MEKITKKDIKLLSHLAEYKFLSVKQLSVLSQRSLQVIRRRLRSLIKKNLVLKEEGGLGHDPGRRESDGRAGQLSHQVCAWIDLCPDHSGAVERTRIATDGAGQHLPVRNGVHRVRGLHYRHDDRYQRI